MRAILIIVIAMVILLALCILYVILRTQAPKENISKAVCISKVEYDKLLTQANAPHPQCPIPSRDVNVSTSRDAQVLTNPLHPPLNRSETPTHNSLRNEVEARNMYVPTSRDNLDRFRLVGYLTSKDTTSTDSGGNNWKLFARQKDRHSAEFYIIPANNNYDIKIMLTDNIVNGTRLRDTYTIPNELSFNTPLLNKTPYEFVEIPTTDFTTTPPVYL